MEERLYELIGLGVVSGPGVDVSCFWGGVVGAVCVSYWAVYPEGVSLMIFKKRCFFSKHFQRIQLQYYGPQADVYEFLEGIVGYIGQIQNAGLTAAQYSDFVVDLQANPGEMHAGDVEEQADLARLYNPI